MESPKKGFGRRLEVWGLFLREFLRALFVPFRVLLWLPRRSAHRNRMARLLSRLPPRTERFAHMNEDSRACFWKPFPERRGKIRHVFLACGEPSGEAQAKALAEGLLRERPELRLTGFGGRALASSGVEVRAELVDRAAMGLWVVFGQLGFYVSVVERFLELLERDPPDLVVLVDNPGLNLVLAERAKKRRIPVLYLVCPQYWAWGPWRLRRFRKAIDGAIAILPFEPALFWEAGIPTAFRGHPLVERAPDPAPEPREPLLVLMPGSRRREVRKHLLPMVDLFRRLREIHPEVRGILPHSQENRLEECRRLLESEAGGLPEGLELHAGDPFPVLARARAALVKSGTGTLETALCRTPLVMVYALSNFFERMVEGQLLTVPWVGAPNLVAGEAVVPEFLVGSPRAWDEAFGALCALWEEGEERRNCLIALDGIRERLRGEGATAEALRWILAGPEADGLGT